MIDMHMSMCQSSDMKDTRLIALVERRMMKSLEAVSKKARVSVAETVRRAIVEYLKRVR